MALVAQGGELCVVGVREAVARVVEQRERFVVLGGSCVPVAQLAPDLEPESAEVAADRTGVGVASFQLSAFDKPVADNTLDGQAGWRDPRREDIAGLVVQVACEPLKLGRQTQNQRIVESCGSPAPSGSRPAHELVSVEQIVQMLSALLLPACKGRGCHTATVPHSQDQTLALEMAADCPRRRIRPPSTPSPTASSTPSPTASQRSQGPTRNPHRRTARQQPRRKSYLLLAARAGDPAVDRTTSFA